MATEYEKGMSLFEDVYGSEMATGLAKYLDTEAFGVECARWSNNFSFGTVWARDDIERKLRSCVVLGMMIALRQTDEIRYHTKMGLVNGLTRDELEAILYTSVPYCGFPASNVAKAAMLAVFAEIDNPSDNSV